MTDNQTDAAHHPRDWSMIALRACLVAAAALYAPAALVLPFSDDWQMSAWAHEHGFDVLFQGENFRFWTRVAFALGHPLLAERIGLVIIPASILAFLATAWFLARFTRRFAPELPWAPVLVAVLYLAHPANATAVIQVDTIGQVLADLLVLVCIHELASGEVRVRLRQAAWPALMVLFTLFGKETALGVLGWIPVVAFLHAHYVLGLDPGACRRRTGVALLAVGAGVAIFFAIRFGVGTPLSPSETGKYSIHVDPVSVLVHAAQLLGCSLYFGDVTALFAHGVTARVVLAGGVSIALIVLAIAGLRRMVGRGSAPGARRQWWALGLWASFLAPGVWPMVLMGSVSDLYVAGLVPFVAVIYGVLIARLLADLRVSGQRALSAGMAAVVAWGGMCIAEKVEMRRAASERTWGFVAAVAALDGACADAGDSVVVRGNLADTTTGGRPYSSFSVSNERILRSVLHARSDPQRAAWIFRADAARHVPAGMACIQEPPGTGEACVLRCDAGASADSELLSCRVLQERCTDTRL